MEDISGSLEDLLGSPEDISGLLGVILVSLEDFLEDNLGNRGGNFGSLEDN